MALYVLSTDYYVQIWMISIALVLDTRRNSWLSRRGRSPSPTPASPWLVPATAPQMVPVPPRSLSLLVPLSGQQMAPPDCRGPCPSGVPAPPSGESPSSSGRHSPPWNTQQQSWLRIHFNSYAAGSYFSPIQKDAKKPNKWQKQMGTHLRVLDKSFPLNTNMTGFRWLSKIFASLCFGRK